MSIISNRPTAIPLGFAIFSMFFGAGNVIYPISVGIDAGTQPLVAFMGFLITGIGAPLLGLYAVFYCHGDLKTFFSNLKYQPAAIWILILILALGPIGATPRCMLLAYQSYKVFFPNASLLAFTFGLGIIIYALSLKKTTALMLLGKVLSPLLLLLISIIIGASLLQSSTIAETHYTNIELFSMGFSEGYQTMDMLAALLFSITIWQLSYQTNKTASSMYLRSILIGGTLLGLTYLGLGLSAQAHLDILSSVSKDQYLNVIAHTALGSLGGKIAALIVCLACITTIIALLLACTDALLQLRIKNKQQTNQPSKQYFIYLGIMMLITIIMSNLGFDNVSAIISIIVTLTYPMLIVLAICHLLKKHIPWRITQYSVYFTLLMTVLYQSYHFL